MAAGFQYARAIINGYNGLVVPAGNMNALASAIESLARDGSQRKRMAESSYNATRSWVWPEIAHRYLDILDKLCG